MLKTLSLLSLTLALAAPSVKACPSDVAKPFVGSWQGSATLLPVGSAPQQSSTRAQYFIVNCNTFAATFNYLDAQGNVVRTIKFQATPSTTQVGLFDIVNGVTSDTTGSTELKGTFRQIQAGTLLGTFLGSLGGKPVYMTELMNVAHDKNKVGQLVRNVQMFSGGRGGPYLASRVDAEQSTSSH